MGTCRACVGKGNIVIQTLTQYRMHHHIMYPQSLSQVYNYIPKCCMCMSCVYVASGLAHGCYPSIYTCIMHTIERHHGMDLTDTKSPYSTMYTVQASPHISITWHIRPPASAGILIWWLHRVADSQLCVGNNNEYILAVYTVINRRKGNADMLLCVVYYFSKLYLNFI